jgi:integrase
VNLKTRKITIKKSLYRNQLIDIRATKQPRVITITKELADILKEWKLLCPKNNQDIVFPNSTGGFMDPDNMIKRRFNPLVEQAGIQNVQFQDLRNTYAYIMLSNNATLEYVQTQMGHYSVDVTFNRYGHFIPEKKEDYEAVFKDLAKGL